MLKWIFALLLLILPISVMAQDLLWITNYDKSQVTAYYRGQEYLVFYANGTIAITEMDDETRKAAYKEFIKMFNWQNLEIPK